MLSSNIVQAEQRPTKIAYYTDRTADVTDRDRFLPVKDYLTKAGHGRSGA